MYDCHSTSTSTCNSSAAARFLAAAADTRAVLVDSELFRSGMGRSCRRARSRERDGRPLPSKMMVMELETGGGDAGGCGGGDDLRSDGGAPASVHEQ